MKAIILLLLTFSASYSFAQIKSQNINTTEQETQIVTEKEQNSTKYSSGTKQEVKSLTTHPFFVKRNEYIEHLIEIDKKTIPTFRSTETSEENILRLIQWAHTNKNLFESSYHEVIDEDYANH